MSFALDSNSPTKPRTEINDSGLAAEQRTPHWVMVSVLLGYSAVLEIPDFALTSGPVPHPIADNPTGADLARLPKSAMLTHLRKYPQRSRHQC